MAKSPVSTGIGQGAAQVFDTSNIFNLAKDVVDRDLGARKSKLDTLEKNMREAQGTLAGMSDAKLWQARDGRQFKELYGDVLKKYKGKWHLVANPGSVEATQFQQDLANMQGYANDSLAMKEWAGEKDKLMNSEFGLKHFTDEQRAELATIATTPGLVDADDKKWLPTTSLPNIYENSRKTFEKQEFIIPGSGKLEVRTDANGNAYTFQTGDYDWDAAYQAHLNYLNGRTNLLDEGAVEAYTIDEETLNDNDGDRRSAMAELLADQGQTEYDIKIGKESATAIKGRADEVELARLYKQSVDGAMAGNPEALGMLRDSKRGGGYLVENAYVEGGDLVLESFKPGETEGFTERFDLSEAGAFEKIGNLFKPLSVFSGMKQTAVSKAVITPTKPAEFSPQLETDEDIVIDARGNKTSLRPKAKKILQAMGLTDINYGSGIIGTKITAKLPNGDEIEFETEGDTSKLNEFMKQSGKYPKGEEEALETDTTPEEFLPQGMDQSLYDAALKKVGENMKNPMTASELKALYADDPEGLMILIEKEEGIPHKRKFTARTAARRGRR